MQYKGGSIIRNLRKDMGVSQEEMAKRLHISQRQLSRVENGEAELSWLEFTIAMQVLGYQTEDFWIMYLDYEEFLGYIQFQNIRRHIKNGATAEARDVFATFEQNPLAKQSFMAQFVLAISCILDEMEDEVRKQGLYEALFISIPKFDVAAIESYILGYNEIIILNELALLYNRLGDAELAIKILYGIYNAIQNIEMITAITELRLMSSAILGPTFCEL